MDLDCRWYTCIMKCTPKDTANVAIRLPTKPIVRSDSLISNHSLSQIRHKLLKSKVGNGNVISEFLKGLVVPSSLLT